MLTMFTLLSAQALGVFLLGMQSLSVNSGLWRFAVVNSLFIGLANLYVLRTVVVDGTLGSSIAYMLGGPVGILACMWLHPKVSRLFRRVKCQSSQSSASPSSRLSYEMRYSGVVVFPKTAGRGNKWQSANTGYAGTTGNGTLSSLK